MPDDKPKCFVIQGFDDGGTFDRRYQETIAPALENAGVKPERADQIPGLQSVVEKIESAIQNASICIAEVSSDNPNVWLEVGYALALDRLTVILCDKGLRPQLPFDIQHRPVVFYRTDSRSGYDELEKKIAKYVEAELDRARRIQRAPVLKRGTSELEDSKDSEMAILSTLLALWPTANNGGTHSDMQSKLNSMGFHDIALGLDISNLLEKGYVRKQWVGWGLPHQRGCGGASPTLRWYSMLLLRRRFAGDVEAGAGGEGDEHFETELLPFAADEIGDTGLTDPEHLGGFGLRELPGLDGFHSVAMGSARLYRIAASSGEKPTPGIPYLRS